LIDIKYMKNILNKNWIYSGQKAEKDKTSAESYVRVCLYVGVLSLIILQDFSTIRGRQPLMGPCMCPFRDFLALYVTDCL
jgi:hypothetical protein